MRKHAHFIALFAAFAAAAGATHAQVTPIAPTWQRSLGVEATIIALDAREDFGTLVATDAWIETWTPHGATRWRSEAPEGSRWRDAVSRSDGGAWALEVAKEPSAGIFPERAVALHRIGPDGATRERRPIGSTAYGRPEEQGRLLLAPDDGVVVLLAWHGNFSLMMGYGRYDRDGQPLHGAGQDVSSRPVLEAMRILPDDGVSYVTRSADSGRTDLTRIDRQGAYSGGYAPGDGEHAVIAIEPDGTASALVTSPGQGVRRESIDLLGFPSAAVAVPALPFDIELKAVSPFIGGRQVAAYRSAGTGHIALVDRRGHVTASRVLDARTPVVIGAPGVLAVDESVRDADAELLSPTTLATTVRFRLRGSARALPGDVAPGTWRILGDRVVYGTGIVDFEQGERNMQLARFELPPSTPCDSPVRPTAAPTPRPAAANPRTATTPATCMPPRPSTASPRNLAIP